MCQFNIIIVKNEEISPELKDIFHSVQFGYRIIQQNSLSKQLGNNYSYILSFKDECDCKSIIGNDTLEDDSFEEDSLKSNENKIRTKLQKKGWSETKISRYLNEKNKYSEKSEKIDKQEEIKWMKLISGCIETKLVNKVGILYHEFIGGLETEAIEICAQEIILLSKFNIANLTKLKENKVLWVTKTV